MRPGRRLPRHRASGHVGAIVSYQALQRHLYLPDSGLYRENHPALAGDNPYSYVWPLREATAATQDVDRLRLSGGRLHEDVPRRFRALSRYWDAERGAYDSYPPAPLGTRGDPFFDDNTVIGLELVRRYRLSGDRAMLRQAERVFAYVTSAWDNGTTGPCPGGMHWVDAVLEPLPGGHERHQPGVGARRPPLRGDREACLSRLGDPDLHVGPRSACAGVTACMRTGSGWTG